MRKGVGSEGADRSPQGGGKVWKGRRAEARRGESSLPDGAGRLCKQVQEDGAAVGVRGKLGHVGGDAKQGHRNGPTIKQALKPLGGLPARVVGVEGEEDAGAAAQSEGHPLKALGAQGGYGGKAPLRQGKPVEQAFRHHH